MQDLTSVLGDKICRSFVEALPLLSWRPADRKVGCLFGFRPKCADHGRSVCCLWSGEDVNPSIISLVLIPKMVTKPMSYLSSLLESFEQHS
jgi:hypothetical protein